MLNRLCQKQLVKALESEINVVPYSLRVINQQLWCCCYDAGIMVFDDELQQQRTIAPREMVNIWDVAAMSNGDVVIAAQNGLYHANKNGRAVVIFASLRKTRSMQATYL